MLCEMNIEIIREYCLKKAEVSESLPFNNTALVFKVAGKMFALLDLSADSRGISLKCDPERAIQLREKYPEVTPAYHFNKQHWNSVELHETISSALVFEMIDHSYDLVVSKLPKIKREQIENRK